MSPRSLLPLLLLAAGACAPRLVRIPGGVAPDSDPPPLATQVGGTGGGLPTALPPEATPEPPATPTALPTPPLADTPGKTVLYYTQAGDTLPALAARFGVTPADIAAPPGEPAPDPTGILNAGRLLLIPDRLGATGPAERLIPDSELVFSANAASFDPAQLIRQSGGFLAGYQDYIAGKNRPAAEAILRAALENSVNPRLLLALVEYQSGWLRNPAPPSRELAMGYASCCENGLYNQLTWAANVLNIGYYGWRAGTLTELTLPDGATVRLAPELNAGSVALQYFFSRFRSGEAWREAVAPEGFAALFSQLMGDPFQRAIQPLLPPGLSQPSLELPFLPGRVWSFTGGPHGPWERDGAWAALDFAPPSLEHGCAASDEWVTASASGVVVRVGGGSLVLDLDGDGREQTGWVLFYMHIAARDRIPLGAVVEPGDPLGHPSCEGGYVTGTHVHIARKFNGEWIAADGPIPFNLSGWIAHFGRKDYFGSLTRGDQIVVSCTCSSPQTFISR